MRTCHLLPEVWIPNGPDHWGVEYFDTSAASNRFSVGLTTYSPSDTLPEGSYEADQASFSWTDHLNLEPGQAIISWTDYFKVTHTFRAKPNSPTKVLYIPNYWPDFKFAINQQTFYISQGSMYNEGDFFDWIKMTIYQDAESVTVDA